MKVTGTSGTYSKQRIKVINAKHNTAQYEGSSKKTRQHFFFAAPFSVIQSFPKEILLTRHFLHFGLKPRSLSLALTFDYITAI